MVGSVSKPAPNKGPAELEGRVATTRKTTNDKHDRRSCARALTSAQSLTNCSSACLHELAVQSDCLKHGDENTFPLNDFNDRSVWITYPSQLGKAGAICLRQSHEILSSNSISTTAHRLDELDPIIRVDFFTETADIDIDNIGERIRVHSPNMTKYPRSAEDLVGR